MDKIIKYKKGTVTGFEFATTMTVDRRFIHYATNSCDWNVHITFKMYRHYIIRVQ